MAEANPGTKPRGKPGRPPKARGAPTSSDAADARWTVRGVPMNVRAIATREAESRGMTTGDWLAEAIVAQVRADKRGNRADAEPNSADGGANVPAVPLGDELAKALKPIMDRLEKLESKGQKPLINRIFGRRS